MASSASPLNVSDLISSTLETPTKDIRVGDIPGIEEVKKILNSSTIDEIANIPLDSNFAWLLILLLVSLIWLSYCIFYHSRLFGFIVTLITNHIIIPRYFSFAGASNGSSRKDPQYYIRIGSLSISIISGKIMFRDLSIMTADYTLRTQDGFVIFRWWLPYLPKDVRKTDLSHSDTRLFVVLNGFELHIYNRSQTYHRLEKLFGLKSRLFPDHDDSEANETDQLNGGSAPSATDPKVKTNDDLIKAYLWRDFIPVTKLEISTGRFVFGNAMTPSTLCVTFEEAHITYTSRPALSPHDLFTHIAKCKAESFKVILIPSPKFVGQADEPPRYMGEGFVVFHSNALDFYYYQDEPGFVSLEPENIELPTGDFVERFTWPAWGLDVKCGKGTDFSYGPWADRQREFLYNFFYPPDYQKQEVMGRPKLGDLREFESFDFRLSTIADASIDILFCKNKETSAMHMNVGPGSYLEVTVPWITKESGYESHILGQILHLDATTSLNFRQLAQSETLEFDVRIRYPKVWNQHQEWICSLTGCKATVSIIFAHKWFFCDLIDDWSSKGRPDLLSFVPYTWKFSLVLKEFELIVLANEHNWIDCSSTYDKTNENVQLAICGDNFDMSFDLPFIEFLPKTVPIKIWIQGESLEAAIFLPEANPHRDIVEMLNEFAKLSSLSNGNGQQTIKTSDIYPPGKKWRSVSTKENGWVPCWSVPILAISVGYTYHPMPPMSSTVRVEEATTPEQEEALLESIRPDAISSITARRAQIPANFDPGNMDPDFVELEVEIGPSTICLYGVILRMLWDIKENYLGECQQFTDFSAPPEMSKMEKEGPFMAQFSAVSFADQSSPILKPFDARVYRPLAVTVSLTMHEIQAHLMKSSTDEDPPCPFVYLERLSFEMDKNYRETKLQLLLTPAMLSSVDIYKRDTAFTHLKNGFLVLDALQFRGHAMFSNVGRPLESETLEYGWLIEISLGEISGRLTLPQLTNVVASLETLLNQVLQDDSALQPPAPYRKCLHDLVQSVCPDSDSNMNKLCPYSEDLKYRMVRLSITAIDLSLVEADAMLNLRVVPVKFATCNLHSCHSSSGVTLLIEKITVRQFSLQNPTEKGLKASKLHLLHSVSKQNVETEPSWLEVASLSSGPLFVDAATLVSVIENYTTTQDAFLRVHDTKTRRLWFLWRSEDDDLNEPGGKRKDRCGCVGGCAFFGRNKGGPRFFEMRSNVRKLSYQRSETESPDDYQAGESLLHRGEPVLGFPLHSVLSCLDDDISSFDFYPYSSRHGPLSPNRIGEESPTTAFPSRLSSLTKSAAKRATLFSRQLSSPARSSSYTLTNAHSRSSNLSATSVSPLGQLTTSATTAFSDNDATPVNSPMPNIAEQQAAARNRSLSDGGAEQGDILSDILSEQIKFENMRSMLAERSKSIESQSTLTEPMYYSADEGESSDSGTLRQYQSAKTHLPGTSTTAKTMSILSDDTFKSLTSLTYDTATSCKTDPTAVGSMGRLEVAQSHASLRSTFSAPPARPEVAEGSQSKPEKPVDSYSIDSFMSAESVDNQGAEEADVEDPLEALVDLHNQMERPIVESPLLMSIYSNHLTRHPHGEWSTNQPPFPSTNAALSDRPQSANCFSDRKRRWTPRFPTSASEGFSSLRLLPKKEIWDSTSENQRQNIPRANEAEFSRSDFMPGLVFNEIKEEEEEEEKLEQEKKRKERDDAESIEILEDDGPLTTELIKKQISKTYEYKSEKLTILLKLNGDTDIKVSPMSLDGLKTMVDAVQPTLKAIHSLTVMNHLDLMCTASVKGRNVLKKEKMLHLGQLKVNAWRSTLERERSLQKIASTVMIIKDLASGGDQQAQALAREPNSSLIVNQYDENRRSKTQAFIRLDRINVILLQTSLVEEVISFSALDHMKDLTCVSIMASTLNSIDLHVYHDKREMRSLKTFINSNPRTGATASMFSNFAQKDLVARLFSKKPKKKTTEVEPLTIETQRTISEETVAKGKIAALHAQLSRLRTSHSILKEAVLTIIPRDQSKVSFTLESSSEHTPACSPLLIRRKSQGANRGILKRQNASKDEPVMSSSAPPQVKQDWDDVFVEVRQQATPSAAGCSEDGSVAPSLLSGFIMFECGLERINVDAVKKKAVEEPVAGKDSAERTADEKPEGKPKESDKPKAISKRDASSFVGELGAIWFNFAAPPKTPNTKRIDYTRLDWHLLSTATPSINAWLSAGDRLLFSVKKASRLAEQREDAVIVALMALALEVQGIHVAPQTKYISRKRTPLAKALHEDPSCQLIFVLRRYLNRTNYEEIEANLKPEQLPSLNELRRGVIALSRQWKNALYMPLLVEQNIKQRDAGQSSAYQIPLRVLFGTDRATTASQAALSNFTSPTSPQSGETSGQQDSNESSTQHVRPVPANSTSDSECMKNARKDSASHSEQSAEFVNATPDDDIETGSQKGRKHSALGAFALGARSSRASVAFPLLAAPLETIGTGVGKAMELGRGFLFSPNSQNSNGKVKRNESQGSLKSTPSSISTDDNYHEENLYNWMSRQQEYMESKVPLNRRNSAPRTIVQYSAEAKNNTLPSANSFDEDTMQLTGDLAGEVPPGFAFLSTGVIADVRLIFEPLLRSLSVYQILDEGSDITFEQLGPRISFSGTIRLLRVDIVESEQRDNTPAGSRSRTPTTLSPNTTLKRGQHHVNLQVPLPSKISFFDNVGKFVPETNLESAAFLCDRLVVDVDLRKVKDFDKDRKDSATNVTDKARDNPNVPKSPSDEKVPIVIVGPDGGISQVTTVVNFCVDVANITQRVNLPLLRLLHQFASMVETVKETRLEMKANRIETLREEMSLKRGGRKSRNRLDSETQERGTASATPSTISLRHSFKRSPAPDARDSFNFEDMDDAASDTTLIGAGLQNGAEERPAPIDQAKCWRAMYYLLQLYEIQPETKTVTATERPSVHQTIPETKVTIEDVDPNQSASFTTMKNKSGYEQLNEVTIEMEELTPTTRQPPTSFSNLPSVQPQRKSVNMVSSDQIKSYTHALMQRELTPIVAFGVAKIRKVDLVAMLSGLKLEGNLSAFHVSLTHKEKIRGAAMATKKWRESSLTGKLGQTNLALLEEISEQLPYKQQLVVKMTIGKSQTLISSQNKKGKDSNSALLTIGPIAIDIPQHPIALHGMVTRSSRQLSTTLQELRSSRQPSRSSRHNPDSQIDASNSHSATTAPPPKMKEPKKPDIPIIPTQQRSPTKTDEQLIKPIVVQFSVILDSFTIGASLLPSLRAQYQIGQVTSSGITGNKAKFVIDVREHHLSFNTNVVSIETNLPSQASVALPPIHVVAEYIEDPQKELPAKADMANDGIVLRRGSYLNATADIGSFEHSLTTDLLNHLLLVQKVFMKEVNEVVQKIGSGGEMGLSQEATDESSGDQTTFLRTRTGRYILFSLHLRLKGIQITATTPTSSAVRLETGTVELQVSNRVQNMLTNVSGDDLNLKLFVKLQVDLNVALGQLIKNALFEEAEPEFQQLAYFKTRIVTRNALQDELISNATVSNQEDKEAVLITLHRPLIYIQPLALDKAVLVWLNYKNAYEYWNEQRANLNKEVLTATQQVLGKVQQPITQMSSQAIGTLFLQLTVDDLGICLPIASGMTQGNKYNYDDLKSALVVTLESTRISACSCGSLVSKAKFTGLCFRFVDDFETSLDDWKPDVSDPNVMNLCIVSEGTYEICSRTISSSQAAGNDAKWFLNVKWKMEGFDIHVDTSIGKQLSALFKTLTALAGDEDELETVDYSSVVERAQGDGDSASSPLLIEPKPITPGEQPPDIGESIRRGSIFKDTTLDTKKRSRLIEKELNEQAKIINDLRQLGASQSTIEAEIKRLHELESVVFNDFRRDVIKKLRRQSMKSSTFRDKPTFSRMQSLASPDETPDMPHRPMKTLESVESELESTTSPGEDSFDHPTKLPKPTKSAPKPIPAVAERALSGKSSCSGSEASLLQSLIRSPADSSASEDASSPAKGAPATSSSDSTPLSESVSVPPIVIAKEKASFDLGSSRQSSTSSTGAITSAQKQASHTVQEPNIDFELDVMIFFNSGKCVFHTREQKGDEDGRKSMPRDRSFVGNPLDVSNAPSPKSNHPRYQNRAASAQFTRQPASSANLRPNISSSKLRTSSNQSAATGADFTIFLIPGLDIKVHYNSKTIYEESPHAVSASGFGPLRPGISKDLEFQTSSASFSKKTGAKKAACYAWMTLHSIPEETVITPHILDFLEQALEPIPIEQPSSTLSTKTPSPTGESGQNFGSDNNDMLSSAPAQYAVYGSFPVDVIVYLHIQPSVLRFSCLPVSRVECLLQLPSVDLVFSSKRAQEELLDMSAPGSSSVPPGIYTKSKGKASRHRRAASDYRHPSTSANQQQLESSVGGLSVTGCLADFSLYIFHPYGGQKKSSTSLLSSHSSSESSSSPPRTPYDRKDSLSLQVEFVKVNISRSRKLLFTVETAPPKLGQQYSERHCRTAMIRFSALCDIGSASFKYDMRRLTEILAFPRAWYRKAIWRRMFLGDESLRGNLFNPDEEEAAEDEAAVKSDSSSTSTESLNEPKATRKVTPKAIKRQDTVNRESLFLNLAEAGKKASRETPREDWRSQTSNAQQLRAQHLPWETLLLFGVNLSKLNVQMNMGNVMGNTSWLTRGFRSEGRVSIDSSGHKSLSIGVGLDGSSLDAKGGIVGGTIELASIETRLTVQEDRGKEPDHVVKLNLKSLEQRLDYMGTSVLMLRISALDLTLRDEWRVDHLHGRSGTDHPTKRPALIFIHSELAWDQLQILMSKSTTPDIMKMIAKVEEFFTQQFNSSKRVLSSLQPSRSFNRTSSFRTKSGKQAKHLPHQESIAFSTEARHHRHWQRALRLVSGVNLSTLPYPLPETGTILGGTVELTGKNISLACFYGINFRSKSWGLFSLREPTISFATEAQGIPNEGGLSDTHIIQNLSVSLGRRHSQQFDAQHVSMATVCKISRSVMFPPQFRHMHEWFQYAFATSDLDEVTRFPVLEFERPDGVSPTFAEGTGQEGKRRISASPKGPELHHNKEVIFAFPSFQMELKTEHLQGPQTPMTTMPKPSIDCAFVTDFDDHIFVAVDAEAYFFLHELITSYIREKDVGVTNKAQSSPSTTKDKSLASEGSTELLHTDWRDYSCHTWHLEPTVRLLSWAGKNIEPYGIDYILQRLGFTQARTTIPKWIQRGAMDPLDKILSMVMFRIIHANAIDPKDSSHSGTAGPSSTAHH